jgi:hypothetical protein
MAHYVIQPRLGELRIGRGEQKHCCLSGPALATYILLTCVAYNMYNWQITYSDFSLVYCDLTLLSNSQMKNIFHDFEDENH